MAIYTNFNQINEYMKIASSKDSCWICAKKAGTNPNRDVYDVLRSLEGAIENKPVIVIRRSGIDTCICMDCVKDIYNTHVAPNEVVNTKVEEQKEVDVKEEQPTTEDKDKKTSKNKKN